MVSTEAAPSTGRPAAFFDLDKTIIARSSTLAFSRAFFDGGLITRRSALRSAYAQFVFGRSGADHDRMEKMRAYLSQLAAGWHVQTVRDIVAETLHTIVDPMVYDEAVGLIEEHRAAGRDVVIVSTSGAEVVEPIGQMLGVDHVIATQMVVEAGRYTGEIAFYAFGANKAAAIRELASEQGYDLQQSYGYSDSETDCPCWRRSVAPTWSIPTARCGGSPPSATGRCCTSPGRSPCAAGWVSGPGHGCWRCSCWPLPRPGPRPLGRYNADAGRE